MAIPLREATNRRGLHHAAKHRDEDDADACVAYTPKTLPRPFHARGETPSTAKIVRSGKENADEEREELLAGAKAGDRLGFESKALLRPIGESEAAPWLTVVLDLDETLVNNRRLDLPSAILRPYVREALAALRQLPGVEVVLWTASTEDTAAPVVRQLSAAGKVFDDVIFRNDQWFTEPYHSKDLALLGRPMDRVIIFDNAPNCCKINRFNSVLVEDFTGYCNPADNTLINLYRIVEVLVREIKQGSSVPETLGVLADEEAICRRVAFELPEAWRRVNVAEMHPLRVPPHGDFFKVQITTF